MTAAIQRIRAASETDCARVKGGRICGASARDAFVMGRFGNLIKTGDAADVGFDLLVVRPKQRPDGTWEATVNTLLHPLARPIDVVRAGPGKLYVLEYTRPLNFKDQVGWLPGRILELSAKPKAR